MVLIEVIELDSAVIGDVVVDLIGVCLTVVVSILLLLKVVKL